MSLVLNKRALICNAPMSHQSVKCFDMYAFLPISVILAAVRAVSLVISVWSTASLAGYLRLFHYSKSSFSIRLFIIAQSSRWGLDKDFFA